MDLAEVHQELVHDIRYALEQVGEAANVREVGVVLEGLSEAFEGLALCHLLEFADTAQLRENLARSGHARRFFLRRSQQENNDDDRHLARSRTRALFAALASGSLLLARDIALFSTKPWNASWEYEDDFAFAECLHALARKHDPFPLAEMTAALTQFERALEGQSSPRFDVAKALVDRDQTGFDEAILTLLLAEQERIEEDRESATVHERDVLYWPNSKVSIEGLGLLKAAELAGLKPVAELPLCPPLARLAWTSHVARDLFLEIEQLP